MKLLHVNRLEREYINSLPKIHFEGKVEVVNEPEQIERSFEHLSNEKCVGFDTESRPAFKKGQSFPVSLVQLATHDTVYLFQLKKLGFPAALKRFLSNDGVKKVGIGIKHDIEKLCELMHFTPAGFIDLSRIANEKGIIQVGARALTARYMARRLVKTAQKTNWAKSQLTPKQQIYAATDAWICLELYPLLSADTLDYRKFLDPGDTAAS